MLVWRRKEFIEENPLTALQTVSQLLLLHPPQEVQCDLQKCLSAAPPLLLLLTVQHLLILTPLPLWVFWVIWTQKLLEFLTLVLHKGDKVLLKMLQKSKTSNVNWYISFAAEVKLFTHLHTLNMESRSVGCCLTDWYSGTAEPFCCWTLVRTKYVIFSQYKHIHMVVSECCNISIIWFPVSHNHNQQHFSYHRLMFTLYTSPLLSLFTVSQVHHIILLWISHRMTLKRLSHKHVMSKCTKTQKRLSLSK